MVYSLLEKSNSFIIVSKSSFGFKASLKSNPDSFGSGNSKLNGLTSAAVFLFLTIFLAYLEEPKTSSVSELFKNSST